MKLEQLKETLDKLPTGSISIEFSELNLVNSKTFAENQIGYRLDPKGKSLIGTNGNWEESWYCIGWDNLGDPIFINLNNQKIFTAMHGEGPWEPETIAENIEEFILIIQKLNNLQSKQNIQQKDVQDVLKTIKHKDYWETFLDLEE